MNTVTLFKRRGSRYWQAKIRMGQHTRRRSTHTVNRAAAQEGAECWRKQLERRGDPVDAQCVADGVQLPAAGPELLP